MSFTQPYFWARPSGREAPHWTSVLVTAPTKVVIATEDAKLRCRIDLADDNGLIERWIAAATQQVEQETGLKLLTQTWDLTTTGFPSGTIVLPFGPLQSVTHVKYTDTASVLQTVASANYLVDTSSPIGRIGLTDSASWPSDLRAFQPVTIRVVVGWTALDLVPIPLVEAVAQLVGWFVTTRQPTKTDWESYDRLTGPYVTRLVA